MIDVDDVSLSFGDLDVLQSVSATIPAGRFVGLVGPNGSGKTTLLRTISGALAPDHGTVRVDDVDVHTLSSRASSRLVSVVPQDTTISFSFDVRHVVEMGRTPYRSRFSSADGQDWAIVTDAMERTETTGLGDRSIDEVSGGERQRVVLARAVAQDTPAILLDEPTASLDVNHQVEMLELVTELVADGKTAVAAIHDLDLAARFCDELIVLAEGTIVDRGPPERVLDGSTVDDAFDAKTAISTDPVTWTPRVTALPTQEDEDPDRVHVIGTGPTTARVLSRLSAAGATCTLGPVPVDDAAAVTARHLDVDALTIDGFSPLTDRHVAAVGRRIEEADARVVVDCHRHDHFESIWNDLSPSSTVVVESPFSDYGGIDNRAEERQSISRAYEELRSSAIRGQPQTVVDRTAMAATTTDRPADRNADDLSSPHDRSR